ncbi:MAG: hypothetical protein WBW41_10765 [Verrucomicrobiia bacterium]
MAWSGEFDGSSINTNNWTFDIGIGSGGWVNHELKNTSRPEKVYVTNGLFQSAANVSGPWPDITDATSPFTVTPKEALGFYGIKLQ